MLKLVEDMYPLPGQAEPREPPEKKPRRGRGAKRAAAASEAGGDSSHAPRKRGPRGKGKATKAAAHAKADPAFDPSEEAPTAADPGDATATARAPSSRAKRRRTSPEVPLGDPPPSVSATANGAPSANGNSPSPAKEGKAPGGLASPLIVKLKMPASVGKPGARASRRSHRRRTSNVAPLEDGPAREDGPQTSTMASPIHPQDCASSSGSETDPNGECWQPHKKSRRSTGGASRHRVSLDVSDKGPASNGARGSHPAPQDSGVHELKARLRDSGAELNSPPLPQDGHASIGAGLSLHAAAVKPDLSTASTVEAEANAPSEDDGHGGDASLGPGFALEPKSEPQHPSGAVGGCDLQGTSRGPSQAAACHQPGSELKTEDGILAGDPGFRGSDCDPKPEQHLNHGSAVATPHEILRRGVKTESLRPAVEGASPGPASPASPADVVELGDSDAELGIDEDTDLVFLGETSNTLAAAREAEHPGQSGRPGMTAQGLPDDEPTLVDAQPGLTQSQQNRREALKRRKMVRLESCHGLCKHMRPSL